MTIMELRVDPEYESKIPPLTEDEFRQLKGNILSEGSVLMPIIVWNGTIVDGHVTKIVPFGAFVELGEAVEGLVHISEMSPKHIDTPAQVVKQGEDVKVKVMEINPDRRRISLSMKAAAEELGFEIEVDESIQAPEPKPRKKDEAEAVETASDGAAEVEEAIIEDTNATE